MGVFDPWLDMFREASDRHTGQIILAKLVIYLEFWIVDAKIPAPNADRVRMCGALCQASEKLSKSLSNTTSPKTTVVKEESCVGAVSAKPANPDDTQIDVSQSSGWAVLHVVKP